MFYNYHKHYRQQRVLKIINNSDRKVDYLIGENIYNSELFEMSKPFFVSRYYVKGKLVENKVKNEHKYYPRNHLKEFVIPYNDWELFLEEGKEVNLFILDIDSLKALHNMPLDSNSVKKVVLKKILLSIDYLNENNWLINFNQ